MIKKIENLYEANNIFVYIIFFMACIYGIFYITVGFSYFLADISQYYKDLYYPVYDSYVIFFGKGPALVIGIYLLISSIFTVVSGYYIWFEDNSIEEVIILFLLLSIITGYFVLIVPILTISCIFKYFFYKWPLDIIKKILSLLNKASSKNDEDNSINSTINEFKLYKKFNIDKYIDNQKKIDYIKNKYDNYESYNLYFGENDLADRFR